MISVSKSEFFATVTSQCDVSDVSGAGTKVVADFNSPLLFSLSGTDGYVTVVKTYDVSFDLSGNGVKSDLLRGLLLVGNDSVGESTRIFLSMLDVALDLQLRQLVGGADFSYEIEHYNNLDVEKFVETSVITVSVDVRSSFYGDVSVVVADSLDYAVSKFLAVAYKNLVGL